MRIVVTQTDIDNGIRKKSLFCPVANAIRKHRGVIRASVGMGRAEVWAADYYKEYSLPERVDRFINLYDAGLDVKPFEFDMIERVSIKERNYA